jgi:hypothetical protein
MMRNGSTLQLDRLSLFDADTLDTDHAVFYLEMGRLYQLQVDNSLECTRQRPRWGPKAGPSSV